MLALGGIVGSSRLTVTRCRLLVLDELDVSVVFLSAELDYKWALRCARASTGGKSNGNLAMSIKFKIRRTVDVYFQNRAVGAYNRGIYSSSNLLVKTAVDLAAFLDLDFLVLGISESPIWDHTDPDSHSLDSMLLVSPTSSIRS